MTNNRLYLRGKAGSLAFKMEVRLPNDHNNIALTFAFLFYYSPSVSSSHCSCFQLQVFWSRESNSSWLLTILYYWPCFSGNLPQESQVFCFWYYSGLPNLLFSSYFMLLHPATSFWHNVGTSDFHWILLNEGAYL